MTRNYTAPESVTSAGLEFNYSVWTPGTTIQLCNVPWTSDYRDIVQFDTHAALDNYLVSGAGPIVTFTQLSYAKPNTPINISLPFNAAYKYNYLRVSNPLQPISGDTPKSFYYFITNIRYIAPNTTELMLQLDVWQTFFADVEFGRCYVERGHIGIANENADNLNGREFLTVPEGFDMGNEYTIRKVDAHKFEVTDEVLQTASIIIVSTVDIEQSGGTIEKPELNTASGQISNWVPSGANVYFAKGSSLFILMGRLAEKPWISQGIIACYMIPPFMSSDINALTNDDPIAIDGSPVEGVWRLRTYPREQEVTLLPSWRTIMRDLVPVRYRHLTKFLTYPYSFIELTMHNGTPLVMKPECLTTNDVDLAVANMVTPPNPRVMIYPKGYNDYSDASEGIEGEYLDFATGIINMPQIPIVNNAYLNYMASNMNSIAFQHTNADWSQQRALQSNAVGFDQATGAINTNTDLTGMSVGAANQSMMLANQTNTYRAATNIVGSAANGLASLAGWGCWVQWVTSCPPQRTRSLRRIRTRNRRVSTISLPRVARGEAINSLHSCGTPTRNTLTGCAWRLLDHDCRYQCACAGCENDSADHFRSDWWGCFQLFLSARVCDCG